jgi:hypothetical protein
MAQDPGWGMVVGKEFVVDWQLAFGPDGPSEEERSPDMAART